MIDRDTQDWIRDAADERAAKNGCRFDGERGEFVCNWIEEYCVLYEGDFAGDPLRLMPWQRELIMRLFSWVRWSDRWQREIRRFRRGSIWVPKKNGKSPTLAALALYLLCGDGEQGQKVFLGAKDGAQAREIAGTHAVEMVNQSPPLSAECDINKNLMRITHVPTRSFMQPLSSSNSRTQQSKEGINGSVIIDETHVVDKAFIRRIERAGISRSEPLHLEFSTAGTDPDSYGKEQFDYGAKVAAGEIENERYLYLAFAASQDTTDEQIMADPVRLGKLANPSWGVTVGEEEFLSDLQTSRRTPADWADFKTYRLNIWQTSASPWLGASVWAGCRHDASYADELIGRRCWAGLDLAQVRDMTALVLVFKSETEEERYQLLPYFWLPEATVRRYEDRTQFRQWVNAGWLNVTPGDVTDFGAVRRAFLDLHQKYDIQELAYDPYRAEQLTQEIEQGVTVGSEIVIEGTGVPRFEFKQTVFNYTEPTQAFERLCIESKIEHYGHPVLAWQIGHAVKTKPDNSGNYRIVKPEHHGIKSVDGVQAAIMGFARAMQSADSSVGVQFL